MQVIQSERDRLIVRSEMALALVFFTASLRTGVAAMYLFFSRSGAEDGYIPAALAALVLLAITAVLFERGEFIFDRKARRVRWQMTTLISRRNGEVPFDEIRSIAVQELRDTDGGRTMRLAIISAAAEVPLSRSYSGCEDHIETLAVLLNQWVSGKESDVVKEGIRSAMQGGRIIEAVSSLRATYGLSIFGAKRVIAHPVLLEALPSATQARDGIISGGENAQLLAILALISLLTGPLLLGFGVYYSYLGESSKQWPQLAAEVLVSGLDHHTGDDERRFRLEYCYQVSGEKFCARTLYIKPMAGDDPSYPLLHYPFYVLDRERIQMGDYQAGKQITIHFDPADPQAAVVITGVSGASLAMLAVGGVLTLIYLFLARRDLRSRQQP